MAEIRCVQKEINSFGGDDGVQPNTENKVFDVALNDHAVEWQTYQNMSINQPYNSLFLTILELLKKRDRKLSNGTKIVKNDEV